MTLTPQQQQQLTATVQQKVDLLLAQSVYNNCTAEQIEQKRLELTEKFFEGEFDKLQAQLRGAAETLPPPPHPLRDVVSQQTEVLRRIRLPSTLSLQDVAGGLPLRQQRDLVAAVGAPLSSENRPPPQQDLSGFWERVERAIDGLSSDFDHGDLCDAEIRQLAPLFLGGMAWASVKHDVFVNWVHFKKKVEELCGLTSRQIEDAFFNMRPAAAESVDHFLLRVESRRVKYNIDSLACFRGFLQTLPLDYRRELDRLSEMAAVLGNGTSGVTDWHSLIQHAKARTSGTRLAPHPNQHLEGFGQVETAPPLAGAAHMQLGNAEDKKGQRPRVLAAGQYNFGDKKEVQCELCVQLGRKVSLAHEYKDCWVNPNGQNFRPSLYRARLTQLAEEGKPVPKLMTVTAQPADGEQPKAGEKEGPTKLNQSALQAFGDDLATLLQQEGANYEACIKEAAGCNLGLEFDSPSPPDSCSMFKELPDLQAHSRDERQSRHELIKEHISALSQFDEADFLAALAGTEGGAGPSAEQAASESGSDNNSDDQSHDSGSDITMEDLPLAQLLEMQKRTQKQRQRDDKVAAGLLKQATKATQRKPKAATKTSQVRGFADKFKLSLPMSDLLSIKPNLRGYVSNLVAEAAYRQGVPLRIIKGTQVEEVTASRLAAERKILEQAQLDDVQGAMSRIQQLNADGEPIAPKNKEKKRSSRADNLMKHANRIALLLEGLSSANAADEPAADPIYHTKPAREPALPAPKVCLPEWADPEVRDLRGLVPPSTAHYLGQVEINGAIMEAIVDSGGARTMMDVEVANALKLPVQVATRKNSCGTFWGPGGKQIPYYGRVVGPVTIKLDDKVSFEVHEVKVFKHSEPLLIIGTDALVDNCDQNWRFCWIGLHPISRRGQWVFVSQEGELAEVDLAYWPLPLGVDGKRTPPTSACPPPSLPGQRKLKFADEQGKPLTRHQQIPDANATTSQVDPRLATVRQFVALVKHQGQRLQ